MKSTGRVREAYSSGRKRRMFTYEDPSLWWTIEKEPSNRLLPENDIVENVMGERSRFFCLPVIERLKLQARIRQLPSGRAGMVALFIESVLIQSIDWTNQAIRLHNIYHKPFELADM